MIPSRVSRRLLRQRRCRPSLRTLAGTCLAPPFCRPRTVATLRSGCLDSALSLRMDMVLVTSSRRMESACECYLIPVHRPELTPGWRSVASSKHLQTKRYLDTLQSYLLEVQRILVQLYLSANERPAPFVDHSGILRDSKTGRPINGQSGSDDGASDDYEDTMSQLQRFDF